jgi:hypothetical protein
VIIPGRIKKYFIYEDKLRRIVSIITGFFIGLYNSLTGILIVQILSELVFGTHNISLIILIIYIIFGTVAGAGVLKLCIRVVELILNGTEIEKYSYLRLVLLVSILAFLSILIIYSFSFISAIIERKIIFSLPK